MRSGVICEAFICCLKIFKIFNISSLAKSNPQLRNYWLLNSLKVSGSEINLQYFGGNSLADNFRFEFEKSSVLTTDEVESA